MLTLVSGSTSETELVVKRSRFIAYLARIQSEQDAREAIEGRRRLYPDARHHCSALVLPSEGAIPRTRFSDDGEPSGTAGAPIVEVLRGKDLVSVVAVVTRYFGGTLLGTGGLVRAYSEATQQAVAAAQLARVEKQAVFTITCNPPDAGKLEASLRRSGLTIERVRWGEDVTIELSAPTLRAAEVEPIVAASTHGSAHVRRGPDSQVAIALSSLDAHD